MKRFLVTALVILLFSSTYAQAIIVNDSVNTNNANTDMVFYNLATGLKTNVSNTDWHLAITVRPTQFPGAPLGGTTIRSNGANGVQVYVAPNATTAGFSTLDTTGWQSWPQLFDADTLIDMGGMNSIRGSNIFDFGWGFYNSTTHNVVGDSVFLIKLPNGDLKKFMVVALVYDTATDLQYANIDNSNLQHVHIGKPEYGTKEFVYLNLEDNTIHDKEPNKTDWDLQFLKYEASDVVAGTYQPKTGVWVNKGTQVTKATGANSAGIDYNFLPFSDKLNTIGWNWQVYNSGNQTYTVVDTTAYFILTNAGDAFKVVFTGFGGQQTGVINFSKQLVSTTAGIDEATGFNAAIYPNPANEILNLITNNNQAINLSIFDMSGKLVSKNTVTKQNQQISTTAFNNGVYLVQLSSGSQTTYTKLIIAHTN